MKLSQDEGRSIYDTQESLRIMSGRYGARSIGDTQARTNLHVISISISTDATTFTNLVCEGNGVTYDDVFFLGGLAAAKIGTLWTAPDGCRFTEIELATGSIDITGPNITGII